jgi:methanethiol S-methyltransferase
MSKILYLIYGGLAYAIGMGGLVFFILFIGSWDFMPVGIDSAIPSSIGIAMAMNIGLIALFGLQHTIMARPGFKKVWTTIIPEPIERSSYVLLSGIIMLVICLNWRAIDGVVWDFENSAIRTLFWALHLSGWVIMVIATFLINHFELFGLSQVWGNFKKLPEPEVAYTEKFLYKLVRHPIQLGVLIGIWFTPTMSMTHLHLSILMTVYVFIGLHYEEIDLTDSLGDQYADYKTRVRKIIPLPK